MAVAALAAFGAAPAHALAPDGQHGWFWQMPQPADGLSDVTSAHAGQLWAVGVGGTIEHSTDGGAHLGGGAVRHRRRPLVGQLRRRPARLGRRRRPRPQPGVIRAARHHERRRRLERRHARRPAATLTNASFVDATHGFVGTADGNVLKTSNGGGAWQTLTVAPPARATVTVDFVDATHGWAGGSAVASGRLSTAAPPGPEPLSVACWAPTWRSCSSISSTAHDGWELAQDE